MLGPLQDNGGPTFTHELLTGSPAIDAGQSDFVPPPELWISAALFSHRPIDDFFNGHIRHWRIRSGDQVTPQLCQEQVQPPINPDGSSTFNVRRGVSAR